MDTSLLLIIISFLAGCMITWLFLRSKISTLKADKIHLTTLNTTQNALQQRMDEAIKNEFQVLAQKIFDEKTEKFTKTNQAQMEGFLTPLKEQMHKFEKQIHETYDKESKDRLSLFHEIKHLKDLNQKMHTEAVNLTHALKGKSHVQGAWGEMVLTRLLEQSGLTKGREYEVQVFMQAESGERFRPDVVVHLPENKAIVIDAKVSLRAYERYCHEEDPQEKSAALKSHVGRIVEHVQQLGRKDYQQLDTGEHLDFILLFVPIEQALQVALSERSQLYQEALDKNIVLVTPLTLIATLRTIYNLWRQVAQNKNAEMIAQKAGQLYDKFVLFVNDLDSVGQKIDALARTYDDAKGRLQTGRGNLITQAEKLKALGAKATKQLNVAAEEEDEG